MTNFLALPNRYPGLLRMAKFIGPYFPKTKYYVEPFSGLARTAKHSRSEIMILNDKSEYANNQCRKKFPNAMITNQDFETCIKRWDSKDTFFLIDPPWRTDFYDDSNPFVFGRSTRKDKSTYNKKLGKYMTSKDKNSKIISDQIDKKLLLNRMQGRGSQSKVVNFTKYRRRKMKLHFDKLFP